MLQVELVPCTQYKFKVAAYEFFHGTGKIFPVWSKEVGILSSRVAWKNLFFSLRLSLFWITHQNLLCPLLSMRRFECTSSCKT